MQSVVLDCPSLLPLLQGKDTAQEVQQLVCDHKDRGRQTAVHQDASLPCSPAEDILEPPNASEILLALVF